MVRPWAAWMPRPRRSTASSRSSPRICERSMRSRPTRRPSTQRRTRSPSATSRRSTRCNKPCWPPAPV
ncbi:Uncharacterised protein [Bordetella pertussis]|nr:Uncharacterised protein [Bordetella pertussis]